MAGRRPPDTARVVIHVDVDCFYAQVEQVALGIPADVPCAVLQWTGLIAVNYAARPFGITRLDRGPAARKRAHTACVPQRASRRCVSVRDTF